MASPAYFMCRCGLRPFPAHPRPAQYMGPVIETGHGAIVVINGVKYGHIKAKEA